MTRAIPYSKPSITDLEVRYVDDAIRNGWGENRNDYIIRFENAFKDHLGVKYAISTSSCTGALHMGLHALGIGPGDEVIMADSNWVATAAPIIHLGATPVFVDILSHSWCLNPEQVAAAISPRTKAIIAVHLYGNLCEMQTLLDIGERYGVPVIEDAAEAIGSKYHGRRVGSLGKFGVFSFHGTKTITTGEGGMFVTNDEDLFDLVLTLSNHGRSRKQSKQFWPDMAGFKYKMSNVQAAIGVAQLQRIEDLLRIKREVFYSYEHHLQDLPITMNFEPSNCINGYWMPTIVVDESFDFSREPLINRLNEIGVDARVFFWPLSGTQIGGRKAFAEAYMSERIHLRAMNLPSHDEIGTSEVELISTEIRRALLKN